MVKWILQTLLGSVVVLLIWAWQYRRAKKRWWENRCTICGAKHLTDSGFVTFREGETEEHVCPGCQGPELFKELNPEFARGIKGWNHLSEDTEDRV